MKSVKAGWRAVQAEKRAKNAANAVKNTPDHGEIKEIIMLELKNISFDVADDKGQKEIIKNLSLTIDDHKFVVITGPNGGGKSTLAKLIAGIEKPTSGNIILNGEDITDKSITDRAKMGISFAFQQPVRFKGIRVLDLLRIAAGKNLSVADACQYLSEVGLCARDYVKREVNASLSGGELKRIEIATVLARSTQISVFDEPEAGIDLWSFQSLIKVFERMRKITNGDHLSSGENSGYCGRDRSDRKRYDFQAGTEERDPAGAFGNSIGGQQL